MKHLNKIIFINSASVNYAEIELNGNVHLIGTQGVGKSTLLRTILFFYNADKNKLGIPREKKRFDEYYFAYQNSYIIYEVFINKIPHCVLAYKVNGKVAFRFLDSAYKQEFFIDENGFARENWGQIRSALGKTVHYSPVISNYQDFRKIIYGDNKGLKPQYRQYAILKSKQYQNIPRTIQNVFLNANLEAKFIKETIINSLSEKQFSIDLENYAKNHLRDFETQINEIELWFTRNKKGKIPVREEANKIITQYRSYNFLEHNQEDKARDLATRMQLVEREKPDVISDLNRENNQLATMEKESDQLKKRHQKQEQKLISDIDHLKKELRKAKAKAKQEDYAAKEIESILKKVAHKGDWLQQQNTLQEEKMILTAQFSDINQKYEALIKEEKSRYQEFKNSQIAEINALNHQFGTEKGDVDKSYRKIIDQIKADNSEKQAQAQSRIEAVVQQEHEIANKQAELKHWQAYSTEIDACKQKTQTLSAAILAAKNTIEKNKDKSASVRKEWELEEKELTHSFTRETEKIKNKKESVLQKTDQIQCKLKQSESSFYGWLNRNNPGWETTIGKVIDDNQVLFNTQLNPEWAKEDDQTLYGIKLNLENLETRVKSIAEYHEEEEQYKAALAALEQKILQLENQETTEKKKLKRKFRTQLSQYKNTIAENEYRQKQGEDGLKKNEIELEEWRVKAKDEKRNRLIKLEEELNELAIQKTTATDELHRIEKHIQRKISLKETEKKKRVLKLKEAKNAAIAAIEIKLAQQQKEAKEKTEELKRRQHNKLKDKGADTKRLNEISTALEKIAQALQFIEANAALVIEYKKDKREFFDQVPQWKAEQKSLEEKQTLLVERQQKESDKMTQKTNAQQSLVRDLSDKLKVLKSEELAFEAFKKSEAYQAVQNAFEPKKELTISSSSIAIISALNEVYYKSINTLRNLVQKTNAFVDHFGEHNIFEFKTKLNTDEEYLDFATDLKEFIEEDKIEEYEKRVNERFSDIVRLIGKETGELTSKEAEIEKVIRKINKDFAEKNFVEAIKEMEIRLQKSSNPVVRILSRIEQFNKENSLSLGRANLFITDDNNAVNKEAVRLLKQLIKELERYKKTTLSLSESFDLEFRIVENDNDSGWVEKLAHVGSEGTDVLVKAMVNILLLNVFKNNATKNQDDFKVHCVMDEIGRLHPTNVKGILRFANERNIYLINGSPTSQNATDYKYTYKLAKQQLPVDAKKYITKVNRLVKVNHRASVL